MSPGLPILDGSEYRIKDIPQEEAFFRPYVRGVGEGGSPVG